VGMEREQEHMPGTFLGDFGGLIDADQADALSTPGLVNAEHVSSLFMRTYAIEVYSLHPDNTITLYEVAKLALFRARNAFNTAGVLNHRMSGDRMMPLAASEWGPDFVFRRTAKLDAIEMFQVLGTVFPPFSVDVEVSTYVGEEEATDGEVC